MTSLSSLTMNDIPVSPRSSSESPSHSPAPCIHGDRLPNLRSLKFVRTKASIVDAHNLTSLVLDRMSKSYDTWNELFDTLSGCPALKYLDIVDFDADSMAVTGPADFQIIELRHLHTLTLTEFEGHTSLAFFLAHLSLPRTATIDITTRKEPGLYFHHVTVYNDDSLNPSVTVFADAVPRDKILLPMFSAIRSIKVKTKNCRLEVEGFTSTEPCPSALSVDLYCDLGNLYNMRSVQRRIVLELGTLSPPL
ncbi:uncharacterized protein C8Q71DRAFT_109409 [Rhodofomes roseus]|uniref:Uncharacterized protein n=1 Tax=Rhodofomes roseus TaxID=34475 RepID=A0ABQ8KCH1_9APHY|nr:uncharacterized protein C8Q71DRAFT_109409 [Rhodofomes roseus]KAH9835227.1 hypothetical protein C8Q71DRAFT_109409 [Rhodofomes roseus]